MKRMKKILWLSMTTKEDLAKAMAEVKAMVEALNAEEVEMEVPAEVEKLSAQEPQVEPLSHDPEAQVAKKGNFQFAQNKSRGTIDRVFSKLSN